MLYYFEHRRWVFHPYWDSFHCGAEMYHKLLHSEVYAGKISILEGAFYIECALAKHSLLNAASMLCLVKEINSQHIFFKCTNESHIKCYHIKNIPSIIIDHTLRKSKQYHRVRCCSLRRLGRKHKNGIWFPQVHLNEQHQYIHA